MSAFYSFQWALARSEIQIDPIMEYDEKKLLPGGLAIEEPFQTWDGTDLFIAEGTLAIMCTERIRNILVKNKVTNLDFERLDMMEWYSI